MTHILTVVRKLIRCSNRILGCKSFLGIQDPNRVLTYLLNTFSIRKAISLTIQVITYAVDLP